MSKNQAIEDFLIRISTDHRISRMWCPTEEYVYHCLTCDQSWVSENAALAHIVEQQAADIAKALRAVFEDGYEAAEKNHETGGFKPQGQRPNPHATQLTENDELRLKFGRRAWTKPLWAHPRTQK